MNNCVLCNEPLERERTNLEHYVHQVLIRNFDKLMIPPSWGWALRRDERFADDHWETFNAVLAPISAHKKWATVKVHERCNSAYSYVGQDFKAIIDNLDYNMPPRIFDRILDYYAFLWGVDPSEMVGRVLDREGVEVKYNNKKFDIVYSPYLLSCGRIEVECPSARKAFLSLPEAEKVLYTIFLGTKPVLEKL